MKASVLVLYIILVKYRGFLIKNPIWKLKYDVTS